MDYTRFNVEDFASNESFIDWVYQSDPEAVKYWNLYISSHPEIIPTVEKARALVINLRRAEEVNHNASEIDDMWANIQNRIESKHQAPAKASVKINKAIIVPFIFLLVCGASWFVLKYKSGAKQSDDYYAYQNSLPDFVEQVNQTGKPLNIQLADGSVVTLENNSRMKYKANYVGDSTRDVYLIGKAFFNVARSPFQPFIVHSNEVFTKVLGTSFHVEALENGKKIVVSVKTGKVSVYAVDKNANTKDKMEGVILSPNQQVNYQREEQSFEKTLVATPEILDIDITPEHFVFDNTPIAEVFKAMEDAYGVEIIFDEESLKECFLTAPLGSEPMMEKFKIICETIGARYEIVDAKVIISSPGC